MVEVNKMQNTPNKLESEPQGEEKKINILTKNIIWFMCQNIQFNSELCNSQLRKETYKGV